MHRLTGPGSYVPIHPPTGTTQQTQHHEIAPAWPEAPTFRGKVWARNYTVLHTGAAIIPPTIYGRRGQGSGDTARWKFRERKANSAKLDFGKTSLPTDL